MITIGKEKITIPKEMKELKAYYKIEPDTLALKGNWLSGDFEIKKDGNTISHVKKEENTFYLEVQEKEETAVAIMMAIIMIFHYERKL